ncbi:ATP-binding cassette domain-containing protein [Lactococcus hircilactis]|uniref:ATP-binding cassette domain-containing protein n=1 Tax=Lactococcus hircilactis TaxID=1494462 RepID=UPI0031B5D0A6
MFKNFNKKIPFGSKVLVTGESGSGKSTLLKMISQEISMDYGEISIVKNGKKIEIPMRYIGFVSQEPFVFNGSIMYNLTLGRDYEEKILKDMLKKVNLEELNLDYLIQNNGENLSGGQKIRLELARVLLRSKSIILVDEVTASLDKKNSKKIRDLIYSLNGVTIIEVAHHIDDESRYDDIITIGKEDWYENH